MKSGYCIDCLRKANRSKEQAKQHAVRVNSNFHESPFVVKVYPPACPSARRTAHPTRSAATSQIAPANRTPSAETYILKASRIASTAANCNSSAWSRSARFGGPK